MEWLEIIELRVTEKDRTLIESLLEEFGEDMIIEGERQNFKIYRRMVPYIDFGIHLFHDTEEVGYTGSQMGLHLVGILKTYGIVRHSIWIGLQEQESSK